MQYKLELTLLANSHDQLKQGLHSIGLQLTRQANVWQESSTSHWAASFILHDRSGIEHGVVYTTLPPAVPDNIPGMESLTSQVCHLNLVHVTPKDLCLLRELCQIGPDVLSFGLWCIDTAVPLPQKDFSGHFDNLLNWVRTQGFRYLWLSGQGKVDNDVFGSEV